MVPTFFEVRIGMHGVKKGRSVNRGIDQGRAFDMELPQKISILWRGSRGSK